MSALPEITVRTLAIAHFPAGATTRLGTPPNTVSLIDVLVEIARLESGWNPVAKGDGNQSWGLYQIHLPSWEEELINLGLISSRADLLNANINTKVARYIFEEGGGYERAFNALDPWSTRNQAMQNLTGDNPSGSVIPGTTLPTDVAVDALVPDWAQALAKFLSTLISVSFWKAVGLGALALLLILIGVTIFTKSGVQ